MDSNSSELVYKSRVVFKVPNFLDQITAEETMNSKCFMIGSDRWLINLSLRSDGDGQDSIGAYLKLFRSQDKTIDATHTYCVLDSDDQPVVTKISKRHTYSKNGDVYGRTITQYNTLVDQMALYLPNDTLTIAFNITVFKPIVGLKKRLCQRKVTFGDKDLNDCRFVVQNKEFFGSKLILSDRSDVFRQMFATNMSEKTTNEVVVEDIDPKVFEEFLRYLYFGDSDKLQEMAEQLLYVSDKYMVDDLKTICLNLLYLQINDKNAVKVWKVMDLYGNEELKTKAMKWIKDNWSESLQKSIANKCLDPFIGQLITSCITETKSKKSNETMSYWYSV